MAMMRFTDEMRTELRKRLDDSPNPEAGRVILNALEAGRVEGTWYIMDGCGCFYGWLYAAEVCGGELPGKAERTILNEVNGNGHWNSDAKPIMVKTYRLFWNALSPLERFVKHIHKGQRPHTHKHAGLLARELRAYLWERAALEAESVDETHAPALA